MASFANSIHHLRLLLTVVALIHTEKLISANEDIIECECHNTETPEVCMECLKSNPTASASNELGIATIITNCVSNHSKHLATKMSVLVHRVGDENLKSVFQACSQGYYLACVDLSMVVSKLKSGDYDKAGHFVLTALSFQLTCITNFQMNQTWHLPESIAYEMKVYEDLSEAAMRIIDRL
ncbi:hypothetical protein JCGZ_22631 [Jatropha curcas]|uniref:Pectinesterase inhibitor domain-containing protein n=1 Tax=Jatropha curcas TaxID=180498 RepID=A0A067JM82_JATCU|nr:pectinesterase inhibitor [Jatropha curcas]KDP25096.1 hypothetical protein JCGZ_22631 [Jatropha curcas]